MGKEMRTLGIILAGGRSTRLYPATLVTTKQLLPVFDKPLIYYPLSTLMLLGIKDYVIITVPSERGKFKRLFENSSQELGINIAFAPQEIPAGIPDAFNIAREWVNIQNYDKTALILGDNIFYGAYLSKILRDEFSLARPSVVLKEVRPQDANRFGIATLSNIDNKLVEIEEKPSVPYYHNWAATGLYFYTQDVYDDVVSLKPSARGELEITDLNNIYIGRGQMGYVKLLRGMVWFDTGTPQSLLDAANLMKSLDDQGIVIGNVHEIAYNNGWVTKENFAAVCDKLKNSDYGKYLTSILDSDI